MTSLIKHRHIRGRSSFINEAIEHYLEHKLPEFEHVEKARDAYNIQLQINALNWYVWHITYLFCIIYILHHTGFTLHFESKKRKRGEKLKNVEQTQLYILVHDLHGNIDTHYIYGLIWFIILGIYINQKTCTDEFSTLHIHTVNILFEWHWNELQGEYTGEFHNTCHVGHVCCVGTSQHNIIYVYVSLFKSVYYR